MSAEAPHARIDREDDADDRVRDYRDKTHRQAASDIDGKVHREREGSQQRQAGDDVLRIPGHAHDRILRPRGYLAATFRLEK